MAYIISFSAPVLSGVVEEALQAAAELGAISFGASERERFIVIDRLPDLERFNRLASEWRDSGVARVRPLGP